MTLIPVLRSSSLFAIYLISLSSAGCEPASEPSIEVTQSALVTGDVGFAFAGGTGSYDVGSAVSWNNHGGVNHSTNFATGEYRVDFPLLGSASGNVQVASTGQGPNSHGGVPYYCKVAGWGPSGTTLQVFVDCFTIAGALANANFYVSFQSRSGNIGPESGYAWADQPSSPSYTPFAAYQWNSAGGNVTITRESTGVYLVNFPGQVGGTRVVEATAYGPDNSVCNPAVGTSDTTPRVRCYSETGAPVDSKFTVAYSTRSVNNAPSYTFATIQTGSPPTVISSYGALASQCGPDGPIGTPVTAQAQGNLAPGAVHVHFPQMTTSFTSSEVIVMPYDTTSRVLCQIAGKGNETGGAYADIECWVNSNTRAPFGTKIVISFSNTVAIFC